MFDIIIPVYNVKAYLKKCLISVKNNISKIDRVIIIDDGSTDGSSEVIKELASDDWVVIRQDNAGLSSARNAALKYTKNDYLIFLDSDDYLEQSVLKKLRGFITENNFPDILLTNTKIVSEDGRFLGKTITPDVSLCSKENIHLMSPAAWDKVYKRNFFLSCTIEFPKGKVFEDLPTIFPLILRADHIVKFDHVLINWVQRESSLSRNNIFKDNYFDVFENYITLENRIRIYIDDCDDCLRNIYLKKIFLDTMIRWYKTGRDKVILNRIIKLCKNNVDMKSILRSGLSVKLKFIILIVWFYAKI